MKKRTYKRLTALLVFILCFAILCTPSVFAEDSPSVHGGLLPLDPNYMDDFTEEDWAVYNAKEAQVATILASPAPRSTTWYFLRSNFVIFDQIKSNYCVPACVQSALRYIGAYYPPSQEILAGALGTVSNGTSFSFAVQYMNARIDALGTESFRYAVRTISSEATLAACMYAAIVNFQMPPFIGLSSVPSSLGFGYSFNSGHSLISRGINGNSSQLYISDPYAGYYNQEHAGSNILTNRYHSTSSIATYTSQIIY